jgi:hypothetical protein
MNIDRYCIIDTETSGPDKFSHRILLFGLLYANSRQHITDASPIDLYIQTPYSPELYGAVYLRQDFMDLFLKYQPWTKAVQEEIDANNGSIMGTSVPQALQDTVDSKGAKKFICAYDIHKISSKETVDRGISRFEALRQICTVLEALKRDKVWLVGHNCIRFDIPFIQTELARYSLEWEPDPDYIIDTGAIVKGRQINAVQRYGERNIDFFRRVANTRAKGVAWSLDKYCVPTFELEKFGVDTNKQHHSAGYDCFVTHCLLQAL